ARVRVDDVPVLGLGRFSRHAAPTRAISQRTALASARSTSQRYTPKNTDTRITTTVVAYTSRRLGHVTRRISARTSWMNARARSHHAVGRLSRPSRPSSAAARAAAAGRRFWPFVASIVLVFTTWFPAGRAGR